MCIRDRLSIILTGLIRGIRWSLGFPPDPVSASNAGKLIGFGYHLPNVVMIGSNIAGGFSLVGNVTSCFIDGDSLRIELSSSLLASAPRMKWVPSPYFAVRKWKV